VVCGWREFAGAITANEQRIVRVNCDRVTTYVSTTHPARCMAVADDLSWRPIVSRNLPPAWHARMRDLNLLNLVVLELRC